MKNKGESLLNTSEYVRPSHVQVFLVVCGVLFSWMLISYGLGNHSIYSQAKIQFLIKLELRTEDLCSHIHFSQNTISGHRTNWSYWTYQFSLAFLMLSPVHITNSEHWIPVHQFLSLITTVPFCFTLIHPPSYFVLMSFNFHCTESKETPRKNKWD